MATEPYVYVGNVKKGDGTVRFRFMSSEDDTVYEVSRGATVNLNAVDLEKLNDRYILVPEGEEPGVPPVFKTLEYIEEGSVAEGQVLTKTSRGYEFQPGGGGGSLPSGGNDGDVLTNDGAGGAAWEAPGTVALEDGAVTNIKVAADAAIAESKLNLASDAAAGTASRRTLGTGATQAAAGNHSHTGLSVQAAGTPSVRQLGTGATDAAAGNDSRLSDARTPTDSSVTVAKLAAGALAALKAVAVHDGSNYPARPTGFASVEWIGPTDPGVAAQNGDTWVPTAAP